MNDGEPTVVAPVPFSSDVLAFARRRLVALGYGEILTVERFEALMERLTASYTEDLPLESYVGRVYFEKSWERFTVRSRTPFEARAAATARYGTAPWLRVFNESAPRPRGERMKGDLPSPRPDDWVDLPSIPYNARMIDMLANAWFPEGLYTVVRPPDEIPARVAKAQERSRRHFAERYVKESPVKPYDGLVVFASERIHVRVMARVPSEAAIAVRATYGEDWFMSLGNEEARRQPRA